MKSMSLEYIQSQPITQGLLSTIRLIGEFKGKQELFKEQSPRVLETLRQAAIIQSVESSNRIEGITAPPQRIWDIVKQKTTPQNRNEQEIAGYRDVLSSIHTNYAHMPFTTGLVLQFHRDIYQFTPGGGGNWKTTDNEIIERLPDGSMNIRFSPVPAFQTAEYMEQLHERFNYFWNSGEIEPLLLIPAYVLDFLCIHPFGDGNGRVARLIALLLLYKAGYEVGRYISLEMQVEETRESYYESLYKASQGWHEGNHAILPWWEYFLGVMLLSAYREFENRVGIITCGRGAKRELIIDVVNRLPQQFKYSDIEKASPGVSRPTINRVLKELREAGKIRCVKPGRDALWNKI